MNYINRIMEDKLRCGYYHNFSCPYKIVAPWCELDFGTRFYGGMQMESWTHTPLPKRSNTVKEWVSSSGARQLLIPNTNFKGHYTSTRHTSQETTVQGNFLLEWSCMDISRVYIFHSHSLFFVLLFFFMLNQLLYL